VTTDDARRLVYLCRLIGYSGRGGVGISLPSVWIALAILDAFEAAL
jgi:hypothetical protein